MKKIIFILLFYLISLSVFSQDNKRDNIWMLGGAIAPSYPKFGVNFNSGNADTFSVYRQMNFFLTNASICDTNGQMLFYTNGNFVSNRNDTMMMGSAGFNPGYENDYTYPYGSGAMQGALILPVPEHPNQYVIFHESADTFSVGINYFERALTLRYSIIDMTLDSGLGAFTPVMNQIIIADTLIIGRISACRHANGRDWWVLAHELWSNQYYELLLTPDSIFLYQTQAIGIIITDGKDWSGTSVFSIDGEQFANLNSDTSLNIFHFDRCTGILSNPVTIYFSDTLNLGTTSCAFSVSGRYLYVCNNYHVFQLDSYASNIAASKTIVATWDSSSVPLGGRTIFYNMKLAPDNKIYISTYEGTNVFHVINSPDSAGLACNITQHSFILPSYNASSMPNVPNYALGPVVGSVCDSLSIGISKIDEKNKQIIIYPNPASSKINIKCNIEDFKKAELVIYNSIGQKVFSRRINSQQDLMDIDVHSLTNGLYNCHILLNNSNDKSIGNLSIIH